MTDYKELKACILNTLRQNVLSFEQINFTFVRLH